MPAEGMGSEGADSVSASNAGPRASLIEAAQWWAVAMVAWRIEPTHIRRYTLIRRYGMRKVEQIEQQIRELSREEFAELRTWLLEQDWAAWEAQIADDVAAGKLDTLVAEALADHEAGRSRPL